MEIKFRVEANWLRAATLVVSHQPESGYPYFPWMKRVYGEAAEHEVLNSLMIALEGGAAFEAGSKEPNSNGGPDYLVAKKGWLYIVTGNSDITVTECQLQEGWLVVTADGYRASFENNVTGWLGQGLFKLANKCDVVITTRSAVVADHRNPFRRTAAAPLINALNDSGVFNSPIIEFGDRKPVDLAAFGVTQEPVTYDGSRFGEPPKVMRSGPHNRSDDDFIEVVND